MIKAATQKKPGHKDLAFLSIGAGSITIQGTGALFAKGIRLDTDM